MNSKTLMHQKGSLAKDEGKLKKGLKALKKIFAKEFLWVLFILLLGLPLALIATYIVETYASEKISNVIARILGGKPTFIGAYIISLIGIYFTRVVVGALNSLGHKSKN